MSNEHLYPSPSIKQLVDENSKLRVRLDEAEENLRAIREGDVDAIIVSGSKGDRVFSLVETESLYRSMVETMNEAGLAVSPDATLLFCNNRACTLLDRPKDRLLGCRLDDIVAERDRDRLPRFLHDALTETANEQIMFTTQNGTLLPMHIWASRLESADGPMICLIGTDLSQVEAQKESIKLLHQQQEELRDSRIAALNLMKDAIEAKNQAEHTSARLRENRNKIEELNVFLKRRAVELSSSYTELQRITRLLSRDLRIPLRVISGYCQLLLDEYRDKIDTSGSGYITSLNSGVQQVNALLDDMLLLSGISSKQMWLQSVNLSVLAREVIEELQKAMPARTVEVIIQDNVVEWADRGFMKQVLQSLLENAWKYTFNRERPKIEFGTLEGQKPQVCFVRDNGTGFDLQDLHDIFAPFRSLVPDSDFATAGAGLAIVERIIQRHGGKVWAEGEKDKGAVFYFNLG